MLVETLEIKEGEVISLIGAGGKTTTMFKLANELRELDNRKVVTTTTTKISKPSVTDIDKLLVSKNLDFLLSEIMSLPAQLITVAKEVINEDKLNSINPKWIDELKESNISNINIIVEADGAARKDFKIPAQYEPVIPKSTDLLLAVVGSRIINQKLTTENLHRASLIESINPKFKLNQPVTVGLITKILLSKSGYDLLAKQKYHRVIPILNQVDQEDRYHFALEVAEKLVKSGIEMVLLTAVKQNGAIIEVVKR
ncbi:selenium cofactor biosynthesis protein YqeC [Natroniella acetigena]|uniref:selenium cofactor biosynthesis protein YqeC n=1 Tax=Natroniella acetigena TaxID=52004 RepID=UPI00200A47FB|nr:selenium cofactor biosynthesis protein YqeC [Natroniella acetigena]MCK8827290.1 selenium cofactor biosynthesis protein YqeC [Natroniella acetigena]